MSFLKKNNFFIYIIVFLSFNFAFSFGNEKIIEAQEKLLNKCAIFILNQKEELKTLIEDLFLKLKDNLSKEDDLEKKIKIISDSLTDIMVIINESFDDFLFPKSLLSYIKSENSEDFEKYIVVCEEFFDESVRLLEKKKLDHFDFVEKSQNITLSAQILTSMFQELSSTISNEIKIDGLKLFLGKFSENYRKKIKEEYKKRISDLIEFIALNVNYLQEIITNINSFDYNDAEISSKKDEFLKECFDVVIGSFSFLELLYDTNFSLKSTLKFSEKKKNKILSRLKEAVEVKNEKYDLTKPLVVFSQEFVKQKKDYFVPAVKKLYQNAHGKVSNFKNLTPTGKFLSTVLDVKQVLFGFVITCVYKHLCIKTKNDSDILKKFIENRLLIELYQVKLSENRDTKGIFDLKPTDSINFKWFSNNCAEIASDLAYIYNNPLNFEKKINDFYEKYDKRRMTDIDDACFEIKKIFDKENLYEVRERLIDKAGKGDVARYDAIYENVIGGIGSPLKIGLSDVIESDLKNSLKDKNGPVSNALARVGNVTSSLLGVVGTMAKNCLMGGGFFSLEKTYEESFLDVVTNFNGKVNEVFSASNGPNGERIDLSSRTPNFNINRSIGEMNKRNIGLSADKAIVDQFKKSTGIPHKFSAFLTSLIEVSGSFWAIFKFEESVKIFKVVEEAFGKFHNYMINKEVKNNDFSSKKESFSDYTLDSPVFDNLRQKGGLTWFYDVIESIRNPHIPSNKNLSRSVLISGPSGSGKTFLTKAFAQTVLNVGGSVRFMSIDPKDLFLKDEKEKREGDILQNISQFIESGMSSMNETFIIHLDEFHLFFSTETGGLNHSRIADFLKLFNDLNEKQKKNPGTGFYIIVSTNKANLVPVEFFQNPSRIGAVVYIDYPDINERKTLIKSYLKKLGIPSTQIDVDLISSVLEGKKVSQGKLIKIIQSAISKSKITKKLVSTEMILSSIDQVSKGIIYDIKGLGSKTIDNLCDYYSSISTLGLCFDRNDEIIFDSATIYPVVKQIKPEHIDNMYKVAKDQELFYGKAFFSEIDSRVGFISLKKTLEEILFFIAGNDYCIINNIPSPTNSSLDDYRDAYSSAINYVAFSDTSNFSKEFECFAYLNILSAAEEQKENPYSKALEDLNVKKRAKDILRVCSSRLKEFISKSEAFKAVHKEINLILHKQKIVRKNTLEENKVIREKINILRGEFKKFFEALKIEVSNIII